MKRFWLYLLIVLAAVAARLVPHVWNFAPVSAVAIVAAVYLPLRQAFILTFAVRFLSDAILGFFSWPLMVAVYASHLFGVGLGAWVGRKKNFFRIMSAPLAASALFFLVTNFAFFYPTYEHNLDGVILSYVNGLPFLRGTVLGDLFYTVVLIYGLEAVLSLARKRIARPKTLKI
ncbi:MAG: hypothetical protein HY397_03765 [Candidatus Doudnabacteria bacterium]|nr:hypothetical protein [Candidatus Doudnabacteria bacterium]